MPSALPLSHPLRNRVTPDGDILAVPQRGTVYGNRGSCFHRDDGSLKPRLWGNRQWICCVLEFKNRRRVLRQPGRFTELFFLDEATAFAAGHRPCFECRRADAERYRSLWTFVRGLSAPISAPAMDVVLHDERLNDEGGKRVVEMRAADVPDGAMVRHAGAAHLVWEGALRPWSFDGYGAPLALPKTVTVLTPQTTVAVINAGYRVTPHGSLGASLHPGVTS